MPRKKRGKIELNEEGVNDLLQELYDDSFNIRSKIQRLYLKWETKVKSTEDIVGLSDSIIKLISAEAKNQDQKLMLLKYLKEIVYKDTTQSKNNNDENEEISSEQKQEILRQVKKELNKNTN